MSDFAPAPAAADENANMSTGDGDGLDGGGDIGDAKAAGDDDAATETWEVYRLVGQISESED